MTKKRSLVKHKLLFKLDRWLVNWLELANIIVTIVTFGLYRPGWDFDGIAWAQKRDIERRRKILCKME